MDKDFIESYKDEILNKDVSLDDLDGNWSEFGNQDEDHDTDGGANYTYVTQKYIHNITNDLVEVTYTWRAKDYIPSSFGNCPIDYVGMKYLGKLDKKHHSSYKIINEYYHINQQIKALEEKKKLLNAEIKKIFTSSEEVGEFNVSITVTEDTKPTLITSTMVGTYYGGRKGSTKLEITLKEELKDESN